MSDSQENLATQLDALRDMRDLAESRHGSDSMPARVLAAEIERVEAEFKASDQAYADRDESAKLDTSFEKGGIIYAAIGAVILFALMGFSTMLIVMMSTKA